MKQENKDLLAKNFKEYWDEASKGTPVLIKTKDIKTRYLQKDAEEFRGIILPWRELPGFSSVNSIRVLRLDVNEIRILSKNNIESIDGKTLNTQTQTQWKVPSSKGDKEYNVILKGNQLRCDCPAYKYSKSKTCKHCIAVQNIL